MPNQSPPPGHLPAEILAGYIDRSLPAGTRASVEAHIADCAACRAELVAAKRLAHSAPSAPRGDRRIALLAAVAATILVVVLLRPATSLEDRMRSERAPASTTNALSVVTPPNAVAVAATELEFVWRRDTSVVEYTLTVLDADGRTRWSVNTADTTAALPDSVALATGSTIYWYVDGLRGDGRSVGTGRQRFTVQ